MKTVEEEMRRRKAVLTRACQVAGDLDTFSKNGSSFEELIKIHKRVQNLDEELWEPKTNCKDAIIRGATFSIYNVKKGKTFTEILSESSH